MVQHRSVGSAEQSVQDIGFIGAAQQDLDFSTISLHDLPVFHHYR